MIKDAAIHKNQRPQRHFIIFLSLWQIFQLERPSSAAIPFQAG